MIYVGLYICGWAFFKIVNNDNSELWALSFPCIHFLNELFGYWFGSSKQGNDKEKE